jgi:N-acyl-D-aspartate/D-glutamate deacylase
MEQQITLWKFFDSQILLLTAAACLVIAHSVPAAEPADYVITNARIYTVSDKQPWAEALAAKDGKIVFVGSENGAKAYTGTETTLIDVEGRLVLPGFIKSHSHPIPGAVLLLRTRRIALLKEKTTAVEGDAPCLLRMRRTPLASSNPATDGSRRLSRLRDSCAFARDDRRAPEKSCNMALLRTS